MASEQSSTSTKLPISYNLQDKVAIVTASTEGIGLSIAKRLAQSGASVVISSRTQEKVTNAVEQLSSLAPGKVVGKVCDVSSSEDLQSLVSFAVEKFHRLDIVVSNAGVSPKDRANILDHTEETWDQIMNVNLKSAFVLTKAALPYLKNQETASIVYISSITAYQPLWMFPSTGLYSVSKTALLGLCKSVAAQLGPNRIRANCVSPGMIHTQLTAPIPPEAQAIYNRQVPLGRFGEPDEVSGLVAFLCSEDASYITGESLAPAGGFFTRL